MLASDTTAAFLSVLVTVAWVGVAVGTVPGLVALVFSFICRQQSRWRVIGIVLGSISILTSIGGLLFVVLLTAGVEILVWLLLCIPLVVGATAVFRWSRKYEKNVNTE